MWSQISIYDVLETLTGWPDYIILGWPHWLVTTAKNLVNQHLWIWVPTLVVSVPWQQRRNHPIPLGFKWTLSILVSASYKNETVGKLPPPPRMHPKLATGRDSTLVSGTMGDFSGGGVWEGSGTSGCPSSHSNVLIPFYQVHEVSIFRLCLRHKIY